MVTQLAFTCFSILVLSQLNSAKLCNNAIATLAFFNVEHLKKDLNIHRIYTNLFQFYVGLNTFMEQGAVYGLRLNNMPICGIMTFL